MRLTASLLFTAQLALAACSAPAPYYDDDIGLEGTAVPPGALAGTFALKMQITTVTDLPIIGEVVGGGDTFVLVTRSYDSGTQSYAQINQVCGGVIRSETSTSTMPDSTWRAVPAAAPRSLEIRDEDGYFFVDGHLELWGLANLDDPWEDRIAQDEIEATEEPYRSQIVDMDQDAHPGVSIAVDGLVSGDFYFVQRKISDIKGVVLSADHIVGLNTTSFEQTIIGADPGPVQQGFPQNKHPDPKQSWTEEIRLDDDGDCDDVLAAIDNEDLSRLRPFD